MSIPAVGRIDVANWQRNFLSRVPDIGLTNISAEAMTKILNEKATAKLAKKNDKFAQMEVFL